MYTLGVFELSASDIDAADTIPFGTEAVDPCVPGGASCAKSVVTEGGTAVPFDAGKEATEFDTVMVPYA